MKKVFIIAFVLFTSVYTQAQESKTYTATLKKYLEVSGSMAAFKSATTTMMSQFKSMYSSVPNDVWSELEKELSTTSLDDLVSLLAPVYSKHLSENDLKEVIKFYDSPVGKKLSLETPAIMQESMTVGQTWGMKIGEKVQAKMKEKGY
ncbi:MAG: DUF2059 domain-containing protein [Azospira oryzae]|jgi:hypothetical protein|nr:MAG: DUF2059 domain-containing protein [Azospira oryzae]